MGDAFNKSKKNMYVIHEYTFQSVSLEVTSYLKMTVFLPGEFYVRSISQVPQYQTEKTESSSTTIYILIHCYWGLKKQCN